MPSFQNVKAKLHGSLLSLRLKNGYKSAVFILGITELRMVFAHLHFYITIQSFAFTVK